MHSKNSGRFAVDEDFFQFRTAPKMMMDRKRNWAENETGLRTKIPKTKLVRNWQICSFGAENENENEIRSVSRMNVKQGSIITRMCLDDGRNIEHHKFSAIRAVLTHFKKPLLF